MFQVELFRVVLCLTLCAAQVQNPVQYENLDNSHLDKKISSFSMDLLYQVALTLKVEQNLIMSPITVWAALAAISEGAFGYTKHEIINAIRFNTYLADAGHGFVKISELISLQRGVVLKFNTILMHDDYIPLKEFQNTAKDFYQVIIFTLDLKNVNITNDINEFVSAHSKSIIKRIVEPGYLIDTPMVLSSALHFKGLWTIPFDRTLTRRMPFYNHKEQVIGEVNMMYNRYTYAFLNFVNLEAEIIELPYDTDDSISMLIILPNPGVTIEEVLKKIQNENLDTVFKQLRATKNKNSQNGIDCYIPRFNIQSNIELSDVFKTHFGIRQLFNPVKARLPYVAGTPLYVSNVYHKVAIEVTEEGVLDSEEEDVNYSNNTDLKFIANRPFVYLVVEKVKTSILFSGFFKQPI